MRLTRLFCHIRWRSPSGLSVVTAGGMPADLRVYPDSPAAKALLGSRQAEQPLNGIKRHRHWLWCVPVGRHFFCIMVAVDDPVMPPQAGNFASALRAAGGAG